MKRRIVIGDIHGCSRTLAGLIENKIKPAPEDDIYFVGDYIDRGPRSREVLDYIMALIGKGFNVYPLKGNHEDMLLNSFSNRQNFDIWWNNGAADTLRSFNIAEFSHYNPGSLHTIPEKYIRFLSSLPLYYDLKDYIIVHAGLDLSQENIFNDTGALLWKREINNIHLLRQDTIIIHGHTPVPLDIIKESLSTEGNLIYTIDAGCVYKGHPGYGYLAALDLNSKTLYYQENID